MMSLILFEGTALADKIQSVNVAGTQFEVALDNGQILDSVALIGAELDVALPDGSSRHVRISDVTPDIDDPDHDVFLHRMLVLDTTARWSELCEPDAKGTNWSFPLSGQWNSEGERVSEKGLTLTCASDALGKCVRFGYKPWKTVGSIALANYHAACIKAVRADYCGNRATTRNGQLIDIYDTIGIQRRDRSRSSDDLPFEAAFSTAGALCVAHSRVPERMTLNTLETNCPRLAGRIGADACIESEAAAGRYGSPLIFIRSPEGEQVPEPSRGQISVGEPAGLSGRLNANPGETK
jgi:hypothetical protein